MHFYELVLSLKLWFLCRYKDYINGNLFIKDPVDGTLKNVPKPVIKYTLKPENITLEYSGIWEILAAKTQDEKQYVYVNTPAGYSWLDREYGETLTWLTGESSVRVRFSDSIFTMEEKVVKSFPQIDQFLKKNDLVGLEAFLKNEPAPLPIPLMSCLPAIENNDVSLFVTKKYS